MREHLQHLYPGGHLRLPVTLLCLLLVSLLAVPCLVGCGTSGTAAGPVANPFTARQLEEPNALVGPGPSNLSWSPTGARLAYVEPAGDNQLLVLYDAHR